MVMNLKIKKGVIVAGIFSFLLIVSISSIAFGNCIEKSNNIGITSSSNNSLPYQGTLRIYIAEPESRWNKYDGYPYHFGFLDFAFNDIISIAYQETYTDSIIWDGSSSGFGDIQEDNIVVMAALFDPAINKAYSNPPTKNPFEAHFVDAAAVATPGNPGSNTANEDFTHTIFAEEGTATWCRYCPAMANATYSVYESGEYPFYFIAFVIDKVDLAYNYIIDNYNLVGYPSIYFDGGYKVMVGGYDDPELYANKVISSGGRDVHQVDLGISVEWLGGGDLKIDVSITNNEEFFNEPPGSPTIEGPATGTNGLEYTYEITATDPDNDDVYYYIDWGDGSGIELKGPYNSERLVKVKHTWLEKGTYEIKVKSRDIYNETSDWVSLEVKMPKNKPFYVSFQRFLDNYPRLLQFLGRINT